MYSNVIYCILLNYILFFSTVLFCNALYSNVLYCTELYTTVLYCIEL